MKRIAILSVCLASTLALAAQKPINPENCQIDLSPEVRNALYQLRWGTSPSDYNDTIPPVLTFAVITDIHGDSLNLARYISFCDCYREFIDEEIQLGDIVWGEYADNFSYFENTPGSERIFMVQGNHDSRVGDDWQGATLASCHKRYFAPNIGRWNVSWQAGKDYYYKDYPQNRIRLIVTDCIFPGGGQLQWFRNTLEDARSNGLAVVIARHTPLGEIIPEGPFNSIDKDSYCWDFENSTENYLKEVDAFIEAGGKFFCWITGDSHWDFCGRIKEHPKQLSLTFENGGCWNYWNDSDRQRGLISEDSFNVISFEFNSGLVRQLRIGNNLDRRLREKKWYCYTAW